MKMKKYSYLLITLIMLLIGIDNVFAKTCYYMTDNNQVKMALEITPKKNGKYEQNVTVNKLGQKLDDNNESVLNWKKDKKDGTTDIKVPSVNIRTTGNCPAYLILKTKKNGQNYEVYGFNDLTKAENFSRALNQTDSHKSWGITKYKNEATGKEYTSEDYFGSFINMNIIKECDPTRNPDCEIVCSDLFGKSSDKTSIAYIIDMILSYVRIIVPILIILLGSLDLGKAVIAGRADEMKKAQNTFIKRIIMGVIIFFVPVIVDIVMWLADIVWDGMGYSTCGLNDIK